MGRLGVIILVEKVGADITFPVMGVCFRQDVLTPEVMELGYSEGTLGYEEDNFGFMGLERK